MAEDRTTTPALPFTVTGPTLTSINPTSGVLGTMVPVTLTGTNLTGATAINITGTGITVTGLTVINDTSITANFQIAASASGVQDNPAARRNRFRLSQPH